MIETGLVALLETDATLAGLISGRIYPVTLPEASALYPSLTYQNVASPDPEFTFDARVTNYARIQIDAYGPSYLACKQVLAAVSSILQGYQGTLNDGTRVIWAFQSNQIDRFENDSRVYRAISEYEIEYAGP
jgi:uncharacterized protein DUF3168